MIASFFSYILYYQYKKGLSVMLDTTIYDAAYRVHYDILVKEEKS